ncbi:MAG: hypothetical protein AAFP81_17325 [Pseudomonadota bacterium]
MDDAESVAQVAAIVEQVFDLQALVRGAVVTGESLVDDPNIGRLGLEFMAVMAILNHTEERFGELVKDLGFDRAA